jgi:2-polyprenyl-3-methyl-5-hydroxy-6-metoxy-1,4-benzoquinol methylase
MIVTADCPLEFECDDKVAELVRYIGSTNAMQKRFLKQAVAGLTSSERYEFNHFLEYWLSEASATIQTVGDSYNKIVQSMIAEQAFFRRHNRYRFSRYDEVRSTVYGSEEYMRPYMMGLGVSTYLWPNHMAISRFFRSVFPNAPTGSYLEVGPGHGMFFLQALGSAKFDFCLGVDISPTSVAMTRKLLDSKWFGEFSRYDLVEADFLSADLSAHGFDTIVMGEVLEHVERPDLFMGRIHDLSKKGAFIFVTTVVNAPAIDHIYLFDTPQAVRDLLIASGFEIKAEQLSPYVNSTLEETMAKRLPLNVAFQLTPQ